MRSRVLTSSSLATAITLLSFASASIRRLSPRRRVSFGTDTNKMDSNPFTEGRAADELDVWMLAALVKSQGQL